MSGELVLAYSTNLSLCLRSSSSSDSWAWNLHMAAKNCADWSFKSIMLIFCKGTWNCTGKEAKYDFYTAKNSKWFFSILIGADQIGAGQIRTSDDISFMLISPAMDLVAASRKNNSLTHSLTHQLARRILLVSRLSTIERTNESFMNN